jgi:hypothetical protein
LSSNTSNSNNSNTNTNSNRKQSISLNTRSNAQEKKYSNNKSLANNNNNIPKSQANNTDNNNNKTMGPSLLSNNSSSKLSKPNANTSQPKKVTSNSVSSNLNRIVANNSKLRNLNQRHSLATMTSSSSSSSATQTVSTQTSENRVNDNTSPLVKPYKTNFVGLPLNTSTSSSSIALSTTPSPTTANANRFYSGQTKFRTNLKTMKEIENTSINSTAISIPLPSQSSQQKKLSQSSADTDINLEDASKINNRWNFDENGSENSENFKINQKQQQFVRKLLPINKANVQQILSGNTSSGIINNQISCSIIANGATNASNIIFFNKLNSNSSSTKNLKLAESTSRPTTSNNNGNMMSSYLELDPSLISNSSPRSLKILSPKYSNVKNGGSLKDPFVLNSFIGGSVVQQEMIKVNNNVNLKLLHEKSLLKQKPIHYNMRKTQSNAVTSVSSELALTSTNVSKNSSAHATDNTSITNNGILSKKC